MNSIKFKIKGYDETSNSLLISFASDTTANKDPEQYPAYAFQPFAMWPDVANMEELKKKIAMAGVHYTKLQEAKERLAADPQQTTKLMALVGQVHEFTLADLTPAPATPFQKV